VMSISPGERARRAERAHEAAARAAHELVERVRALPDGARKAEETTRAIARLRTFIGYREHPKYAMMGRYLVYKQAIVAEADRLVDAGVLDGRDDAWFLTFDELEAVVRTGTLDHDLVARRREAYRAHHALRPPRVMTSTGELLVGRYRRSGVPTGALVGTAVSTGVVEGRARVVRELAAADVGPGDVLVTVQTDPSWTPAFVTAAALVTEVGGTMTHGAVIAREYGIPAVVGVEDATSLIADGCRIRVDGTAGYVELLEG
jgi:phosphoenolpyruvate synthase/pyruvate phosphate dikinase